MEYFYLALALSAASAFKSSIWLINRMQERSFCIKAKKDQRDAYYNLSKVDNEHKSTPVRAMNSGFKTIKKAS